MKKTIQILLLFIITFSYSQEYTNSDRNQVNNIKYGLYNTCTNEWLAEPTRKGLQDAYEDLEIYQANHPEDACMRIAPAGIARIDKSTKWKATKQQATPDIRYSIDSITRGLKVAEMNEFGNYSFAFIFNRDSTFHVIKLQAKDSLNFNPCEGCPAKDTTFNIRTNYLNDRPESYEQIEMPIDTTISSSFKIEYFFERSQDTTGTLTQTYANNFWSYYRKEAGTIEEINTLPFVFASDNPGDGLGDPGTEGYAGTILRRHSQRFEKKYYQIKAVEKDTGTEIILEIQNNESL